jgi:hypothetical protein
LHFQQIVHRVHVFASNLYKLFTVFKCSRVLSTNRLPRSRVHVYFLQTIYRVHMYFLQTICHVPAFTCSCVLFTNYLPRSRVHVYFRQTVHRVHMFTCTFNKPFTAFTCSRVHVYSPQTIYCIRCIHMYFLLITPFVQLRSYVCIENSLFLIFTQYLFIILKFSFSNYLFTY